MTKSSTSDYFWCSWLILKNTLEFHSLSEHKYIPKRNQRKPNTSWWWHRPNTSLTKVVFLYHIFSYIFEEKSILSFFFFEKKSILSWKTKPILIQHQAWNWNKLKKKEEIVGSKLMKCHKYVRKYLLEKDLFQRS